MSRNSILQQVYFEKVGSRSTLILYNVCYNKNENEDDALSFCLTLDRNSRAATQHSFTWGGFPPRTNLLTLHLPFLTERIPFIKTFYWPYLT